MIIRLLEFSGKFDEDRLFHITRKLGFILHGTGKNLYLFKAETDETPLPSIDEVKRLFPGCKVKKMDDFMLVIDL